MPDLSVQRVEEYLVERNAAGYSAFLSRRSLTPLLDLLSWQGLLAGEEPVGPVTQVDVLLTAYSLYLREERGLAASTVEGYVTQARCFGAGWTDDGDLRGVSAAV